MDLSFPIFATSPSTASNSWGTNYTPLDSEASDLPYQSVSSRGTSSSQSQSPIPEANCHKRMIKPHRKTRQGCFNCKRRKVKCSEERPACIPCTRNGLRCIYPLTREAGVVFPVTVRDPQMQSMAELHSGRLEYTALDMRLLHQFISDAYPHLPVKCDEVWKKEVPLLAHQYKYLMHSLLALSAAFLSGHAEPNLAPASHFHRLRAIEGINQALNTLNRSVDDDDALMSACYALTFGSAHIGDSPTGFWITVRTLATISTQMYGKHHLSRFNLGEPDGDGAKQHAKFMTERLQGIPRLRPDLTYEAINAVQALAPLCQSGLEKEIYDVLLETLYKLLQSSLEGYLCFGSIYVMIATMPHSDFERLTNPNEQIIQLLQHHFLAVQTILGPILSQEWAERGERAQKSGFKKQDRMTTRWADRITRFSPNSPLRKYQDWPMDIHRRADDGTLFQNIFEVNDGASGDEIRDWTKQLAMGKVISKEEADAAIVDYRKRCNAYGERMIEIT